MVTTAADRPSSLITRKRDEAKRIRRLAEHLAPVLAIQVRRDAAELEIEADALEGTRRSSDLRAG